MTARQALRQAQDRLQDAGVTDPRGAWLLLERALEQSDVVAHPIAADGRRCSPLRGDRQSASVLSALDQPLSPAALAHLDLAMLLTTFALAVCATVLAAVFPAWRACRLAPARLLKIQ